MFLENSRGFRVYLRARKLDQILKRTKLVRRIKNKIFPHVRIIRFTRVPQGAD